MSLVSCSEEQQTSAVWSDEDEEAETFLLFTHEITETSDFHQVSIVSALTGALVMT